METVYPLLMLFLWTIMGLSVVTCSETGPQRSDSMAIRIPLRQGPLSEAQPAVRLPAPRATRKKRAASGISFMDMIDNLRGKSGQGYYVEMAVGNPAQKVSCLFFLFYIYIYSVYISVS